MTINDVDREAIRSSWQRLIEEMDEMAEELRADGWTPIVLHPGEVSVVADPETFGIYVLIPDNEFEELESLVDRGGAFDSFEIYKNTGDTYVYAIVSVTNEATESAVLYPIYYTTTERQQLAAQANEQGEVVTYLRTLSDQRIVLTHDPDAFFDR
jgi:hypothetical protein